MSTRITALRKAIAPCNAQLSAHPLYQAVHDPASIRTFMQYHIYAVWDFMSLLKALQQSLTCVEVPWTLKGTANSRFLINEIVTCEESDVDEHGKRTSHFEIYLRAMQQVGASTDGIAGLLKALGEGMPLKEAIKKEVPVPVQPFLEFTFATIASGEAHRVAAVFTLGREDLIPNLFQPLLDILVEDKSGSLDIFRYYVERHIEIDGDQHSHLAMAMLEELCGDDDKKWHEAASAAIAALEARIVLWDSVLAAIKMLQVQPVDSDGANHH